MEPSLIVRIFVHGLLLFAPDDAITTPPKNEFKRLYVLLPDAREHSDIGHHIPMLVYCGGGQSCSTAEIITLAEGKSFEDIEISWEMQPEPASSVMLRETAGDRPMARFPTSPSPRLKAKDFDWLVSLSAVIGESVELKEECKKDPFLKGACPVVARVTLTEGVVSTCSFVHGKPRVTGERLVPALEFVSPGQGPNGAMANIMIIELSAPLSQVKALMVEGSEGTSLVVGGPNSDVPDQCNGMDFCADLAIANTPEESNWNGQGKHFRELYNLVDMPIGSLSRPYPMVLWGADAKPVGDIQDSCPMPAAFYKAGGFLPERMSKGPELPRYLFHIENRPICPPGTP